jgi:cytoskeleton protein RodZ
VSEFPESHNVIIESAGTALHDERRRQSLSIGDVSRHLKLSVRQVEALEKDEFEVFGGAVFVHGFLRNYAKLLGLDPGTLIRAADRTLDPPVETNHEVVSAAAPNDGPQKSVIPLFLVAAILIAGVFGWMLTRESGSPVGRAPSTEDSGSTSESADTLRDAVALTEPGADEPVAGGTLSQRSARQVPDVPSAVIRLVFDAESWVEISDRYGEIIFTNLVAQGETRRISGRPPLSLVIGNASGVKLTFNDKAIDLDPHTRVGVARLTLE